MIFKCRFNVPFIGQWKEVEAESPEAAANSFHYGLDLDGIRLPLRDAGGEWRPGDSVSLAVVEVEGHEPVISRVFKAGIVRRGGVKPKGPSFDQRLAEVAALLGWTKDPRELIAPGWEGENEKWG